MNTLLKTLVLILLFSSCKDQRHQKDLAHNWETHFEIAEPFESKKLSQEFKDYWYAGEAEISSYELEQARYGETRTGKAVLIYVTEDFLPKLQVKANNQSAKNIAVLKLNTTKNFNTGIYPYSIMQSVFYPVSNNQHALKVSSSIQEWCGHVYTQLNNRDKFEIMSHSYFEGEADQQFNLNKSILENELFTQLRINPKSLPEGSLEIIPSFEFCRLSHKEIKPYKAIARLKGNDYEVNYPELDRTLSITFNPEFPYQILGWEETYKSGFGSNSKTLTTKAILSKRIKSSYWNKNSNKHEFIRDSLNLN
ncbi:septum formation inhibitor Maf [Seonamhaeicola sediminis]|uniref:Septum formation inhibitor Maf n=1 Tax=Seonamhaeicola sediminis TaxID=2528206 RepID=A0A562YBP3_9FLAO|nr:septum formation inhibitor Maf [Seonamhaeicola sediminis]TWO31708.1 septum formation inhibitor Maf [Seonamhaeicola sediminis]